MRRFLLFIFLALLPAPLYAFQPGYDAFLFKPVTDGGKFLTTYQSQTLKQLGFNIGLTGEYAWEPIELSHTGTTGRAQGVIDDWIVGNAYFALGLTDWWTLGVNLPVVVLETFFDPNNTASATIPRERIRRLGDVRAEMKFRLVNIDDHKIGLAIIPFAEFPTGDSRTFTGNEQTTGGGLVALDFQFGERLTVALNTGYEFLKEVRFLRTSTAGNVDDILFLRGAIGYDVLKSLTLFSEIYYEGTLRAWFRNTQQNPTEAHGGLRWGPEFLKGVSLTLAGGAGVIPGFAASDWRAIGQLNYKFTPKEKRRAPPPPPVELAEIFEEKIVIMQKVHFAFDRAVIRKSSYPILNDVASLLKRNRQIKKVRIEGHTDHIGSDKYNEKLSKRRANAVKKYLIEKGVATSRLEGIGFGESRPIADNKSDIGRAKNRRTEFTILESK